MTVETKARPRAKQAVRTSKVAIAPKHDLPLGQILDGDCVEAMRRLPDNSVDLVFADPPYADADQVPPLFDALGRSALLAPNAFVVLEHATRGAPPMPATLSVVAEYK